LYDRHSTVNLTEVNPYLKNKKNKFKHYTHFNFDKKKFFNNFIDLLVFNLNINPTYK